MRCIGKSVLIVALVATAIAAGACRREVPEPRGLGAKDIASQQQAN
jgi:hypothetical protein